jgi:hypothetical protein
MERLVRDARLSAGEPIDRALAAVARTWGQGDIRAHHGSVTGCQAAWRRARRFPGWRQAHREGSTRRQRSRCSGRARSDRLCRRRRPAMCVRRNDTGGTERAGHSDHERGRPSKCVGPGTAYSAKADWRQQKACHSRNKAHLCVSSPAGMNIGQPARFAAWTSSVIRASLLIIPLLILHVAKYGLP